MVQRVGGGRMRLFVGLVVALLVSVPAVPVAAQQGSGPGGFADVAADAFYAGAVAALAADGVFAGTECAGGGFCGDGVIDRKTMAVWVVRVVDGADPEAVTSSRFGDVDASGFHAPFVERMAALGVTAGCGDRSNYCPDDSVTRAQMAVFLTRAFDLAAGSDAGFGDVASDAWYRDEVNSLAASGITAGCGDGSRFCPGRDTNRGQMALFLARASGAEITVESPDRAALVALFNATDGPNWSDKENWLTDKPLWAWEHVRTDARGRVVELSLTWNNLTGSIPPELGNLSRLDILNLSSNHLTGPIPPELGNLSSISVLALPHNSLTGSIPPELGQLTNLEFLNLGDNDLTGAIPTELGQLTNLQHLLLHFNDLTGAIPTELGQLTNLELLRLWVNGLTGAIPTELGQLTNLEFLNLGNNDLTGAIPTELGQLTSLEFLNLGNNDLTGAIPSELGQLTNLESLGLSVNALTGYIPSEVIDLPNLNNIDLPAGMCIRKEQLARAIELRISAYTCESDGRLLQSALMREDSNGVSIALPDDLRKPAGMTVSDPSVVAVSVADGWLELTPRGIGTAQVELVPSNGGDPAVAEVVVRPAVGTFGIDIVMERPAPLTYAEALMNGADWWSRVLDGTEWPDRRAECDSTGFDDNVKAIADELLIYAIADDRPGVVGYADTCFRSPGTQVALDPGGGVIGAPSGLSMYLVVHEIGHILGLVLWGPETGLVSEDRAFFIGPRAVEAFRASGFDMGLPGVPIDDGTHWGDGDGDGGMVPDNLTGAISVAALADAGYTVAVTNPEPPSW